MCILLINFYYQTKGVKVIEQYQHLKVEFGDLTTELWFFILICLSSLHIENQEGSGSFSLEILKMNIVEKISVLCI